MRQLKVAHDTAVKDRSAAMVTLKAILMHAPEQLRQDTADKTQIMLARHLAALRPRALDTPEDSIRLTLGSIAKRWLNLDAEAKELADMIEGLVTRAAPQLLEAYGIGADTAAEIIVARDNPERPTIAYVARRTAEGKSRARPALAAGARLYRCGARRYQPARCAPRRSPRAIIEIVPRATFAKSRRPLWGDVSRHAERRTVSKFVGCGCRGWRDPGNCGDASV
ncbi:hypothetical protein [Paenarthrobacter sp. NPDC058040]